MIPPRTIFHRPAQTWRVDSIQFANWIATIPASQHGRAIQQARTWCVRVNHKLSQEN
jgi:hypothetical protein